jgi:S-formylglutathione hydrolase FrmB
MRQLFLLFIICISSNVVFGQIDTIEVYSKVMGRSIPSLVITPKDYDVENDKLPVLYLLHGAGGYFSNWLFRVPEIEQYADDYNLIIVCPDGDKASWYIDSPIDSSSQYESYITKELVPAIDQNYRTIRQRRGRAITGLSMGGHGAFYLAFRNQDVWGAAGSMSGGVDIIPFAEEWNMDEILGSYREHKKNWQNNSVINLTNLLDGELRLIFDCGTEDFFAEVNEALHQKLINEEVPHEYTIRPGNHNWDYWRNSIKYHLIFFDTFFHSSN